MIEKGKGGAIVNISSVSAQIAEQGKSVYSISKAALDQLTRCMSLELGPHQASVPLSVPNLAFLSPRLEFSKINIHSKLQTISSRLPYTS